MISAEENIQIIVTGYERWRDSRGADCEYWISILDESFRIASIAGSDGKPGYFRPSVTVDDLRFYLEGIHREWRMELFDVLETIAQDDRVVVRINAAFTHRRTGKLFTTDKLDYWRMRNGKIAEFFECFDTAAMENARRL
ncbi:MAG: nuclear transport factor 2 family protein [Proteobacteria bacterium]|nr:nuclear transport factor 2 family protein [Pseudomonadota bacterium]